MPRFFFAFFLLACAQGPGQDAGLAPRPSEDQRPAVSDAAPGNFLKRLQNPYRFRTVRAVDFRNSSRLGGLIRAGQLYLTLQDAVDLAIENNLDIQLQRFNSSFADSDILRAKGGGILRGIDFNIRNLPQGIGGPGSPLITTVGGTSPITTVASNSADLAPLQETTTSLLVNGPFPYATGAPVPQFDPTLTGTIQGAHATTLQTSLNAAGVNPLVVNSIAGNLGYNQGFSTGTGVNLSFNENRNSTNALRNDYNPYTAGALALTVTQPLLQGFSISANRRFIRIAENTRRISDQVFKQQLIETLWSVARLYYDLVSLNEDVRVKQQAADAANKLFEDNKAQVDVGTLAPIEVKRAQAEVARTREDLSNSRNLILQQELILKNVLTRRGTVDPVVSSARIVPLDPIAKPTGEAVAPVDQLVASAFRNRPDLSQAALQIQNSEIGLKGSRNALLPTLDVIGTLQNNGFAGDVNSLPQLTASGVVATPRATDPALLGGGGSLVSQIFSRNYPTYAIGIQLNVSLRNRVAQADVIRDELQLRQSEVRRQQLENQVRLEVENAQLNVQRALATYRAAVETRELQEEALDAERQRYQVGASTTYLVIQYQRDLAQARSTEVISLGNFAKAHAALDRATGQTLDTFHITVEDALKGVVSR